MSRLIDADELKERFCEENCGKNRCVDHMDKCVWILSVEESKTVFDVDKVVEQLEEELELTEEEKKRCVIENYLQYDFAKGYAMGVYNAIDIVKGGGVE